MTPKRYMEYFNEVCKEEGVYELCIGWQAGTDSSDRRLSACFDGRLGKEAQIVRVWTKGSEKEAQVFRYLRET